MKQLEKKLKAAREKVNALYPHKFNTPEWDDAMSVVRALCEQIGAAKPKQEFCSIDSGEHRTRLLDGRII